MKILITGAKGQLGQELIATLEKDHSIVPTDTHNLDITNPEQTKEFITKEKPDWVINSAAYTDVEGCAKDPAKAMLINAQGTKNIALSCKEIGAKLVYISSNEVFDGQKSSPYLEKDETNPINPYAVSKLAGERFTQDILGKNFIIARTSWLYGSASKVNFPNKILNKAREDGELEVVDDEFATPTYTTDLATWLKELIEKNLLGTFHLVNTGSASRFDWAENILRNKSSLVEVKRTKLKNYKRLSIPPAYSVLNNEKAKRIGLRMRDWKDASAEYLAKIPV